MFTQFRDHILFFFCLAHFWLRFKLPAFADH